MQGFLLSELISRCEMMAVTMGSYARGPDHTYQSGSTKSTVDYILADLAVADMVQECWTHEMEDQNTSNHLPQTVVLSCAVIPLHQNSNSVQSVDWDAAVKDGKVVSYAEEVERRLQPYIYIMLR